jgi:two-component system LytT family response regulator
MIRCLAIDDEPLALRQLAAYIGKIPFLELAGQCQSALEARKIMEDDMIDAIFVDINMPDLNGMDFVRSLAAPPIVVFTTAYSEYAVEGYKVNAVDYLLKPFGLDDFKRAANKVKKQYDLENAASVSQVDTDDALFFKTEHRVVRININDIRYIEGMSEYLKIYIDNQKATGGTAEHEETGRAIAHTHIHAHTPFLYRQPEEDSGGEQEPSHHGCRHLSAHRRPVSRCVQRLSEHEIPRQINTESAQRVDQQPHVQHRDNGCKSIQECGIQQTVGILAHHPFG